MSREVRKVPADWSHPKDQNGNYRPIFEYTWSAARSEEWAEEYYMPKWTEAERTHFQMYESTSEGTPISPVCETPEKLARWLADNEASAFADNTASYSQWLNVCYGGYAPSAVLTGGRIVSGVAGMRPSGDEIPDAVADAMDNPAPKNQGRY